MFLFLARRLFQAVLILLGVSMITYGLLFLIPADPVRMIAGRSATAETVASIRAQLGLDQPVPIQYLRYLGSLLQGDLGRSYVQKAEVSELIVSHYPQPCNSCLLPYSFNYSSVYQQVLLLQSGEIENLTEY